MLNPKMKLGITPAPGVAGRATRPVVWREVVFYECGCVQRVRCFPRDAENCARDGRAPGLNFASTLNPAGRFWFQPVAAKAHQDRATSATSAASRPPDEYGCSGPGG